MTFGGRWAVKPPTGVLIDPSHPLTKGLVGFYPLNQNTGLLAAGAANSGLGPMATNLATWSAGASAGLRCTAVNAGAAVTLPAYFQQQFPLTVAVGMRHLGAATNYCAQFGININSAGTAPYNVLLIGDPSGVGKTGVGWDDAGAFTNFGGYTRTVGADVVYSATVAPGLQQFFANGALNASTALAAPAVAYATTADLGFGDLVVNARNPNALYYWGALWNRALTPQEHSLIGSYPNAVWQIFQPQRGVTRAFPRRAAGNALWFGATF